MTVESSLFLFLYSKVAITSKTRNSNAIILFFPVIIEFLLRIFVIYDLVALRGVEPLTSSMPWRRASQLRYRPIYKSAPPKGSVLKISSRVKRVDSPTQVLAH